MEYKNLLKLGKSIGYMKGKISTWMNVNEVITHTDIDKLLEEIETLEEFLEKELLKL